MCGHDDCSPQMCCSPEMYGCSQMYCSPERAATTERTAATENHERFAYTLPSPRWKWSFATRAATMAATPRCTRSTRGLTPCLPSSPPVEDYIEDYKVFGASTNLTTLQPGPRNISSSVQCRTPHCN